MIMAEMVRKGSFPYRRGTVKSVSKKKKTIGKAFLLAGVAMLYGCNDVSGEAYATAIRNGFDALIAEDYERAEVYFELAQAKADDGNDATLLLEQAKAFNQALNHIDEGHLQEAMGEAEAVVTINSLSESLNVKGQELVAFIEELQLVIQSYEADFDAALLAQNEGDSEGAMAYLTELIENGKDHAIYFPEIYTSAEDLISQMEAERSAVEPADAGEKTISEKVGEEKGGEELTGTDEAEEHSLDNYSVQEIEYARIILMTGLVDPESPTVYVGQYPAGSPVAEGYEETVTFPMATTALVGEYGFMGLIIYSSHGDGHITIYPVPSHWHQEDQSPEGYREYAQSILDDAVKVYVDPGNPEEVIQLIESIRFEHY